MSEITDEMILQRAQEIAQETGKGLVDAMLEAEEELKPKAKLQTTFTITVTVKPRIARWIAAEFGGHAKYSIEERLAAYVEVVLGRSRVSARRAAEIAPEIGTGEAVTMTRQQFESRGEK